MLNFVLHRVATIAAGPVDRYSFPLHTAEHFSKRLPRELPQQIKKRHLCCRVRSPQADAVKLVVAATAIKFGEQRFQMAGIFALEERCDPAQEHGIKFAHPSAIGDSNSFVSIVGADPSQIGRTILQQFNRSDGDGLVESVELQDWATCDFGKLILHRIRRFGSIDWPASYQTGGNSSAKKIATTLIHGFCFSHVAMDRFLLNALATPSLCKIRTTSLTLSRRHNLR